MAFLTDQILATGVTLDDLIHIVITGDTSQNPAGSSYKATIGQVLNNVVFPNDYWTSGSTGTDSIKAVNSSGLDATGNRAVAWGEGTLASGQNSTAYGYNTIATGTSAHAEGALTMALNDQAHAEGNSTIAYGVDSHAEGDGTITYGGSSHAEGSGTIASGDTSHAEGFNTTSVGGSSHTEGGFTKTYGTFAHAEGGLNFAGTKTFQAGVFSSGIIQLDASYGDVTSEFTGTKVITDFGVYTFNTVTYSSGTNTEIFLDDTSVINANEVIDTTNLESSFANFFTGLVSHSEGVNNVSYGNASHSEGGYTIAAGQFSHSEGYETTTGGLAAHTEGYQTTAFGDYSHAEGKITTASGDNSHAEGEDTTASGDNSHTEGAKTIAIGNNSHAEGFGTITIGFSSHAEGYGTITDGFYQHAQGKWNATGDTTQGAFILGNGTNASNRSNLIFAANDTVNISGKTITTNFQMTSGATSGYVLTSTDNDGNAVWKLGYTFTGGTVPGETIFSSGLSATTISATTIGSPTDCVDDLYVSNIHSCSPLNINPLDEGNVYFGSTSAVTIDLTNNRLGVGITSPQNTFHVRSTAVPSTSENIARFDVSDSTSAYFGISNGTTGDGNFQPKVFGRQSPTSNSAAVVYAGVIDSIQDSGSTPVTVFQTHLNTLAPVVTRPLFQWSNWNVNHMTMNSDGDLGLGVTSPTAKLHINNTTSGNTFLAEDSTNPDSTPFVIDASGNTGIGTATPSEKLHVDGVLFVSGGTANYNPFGVAELSARTGTYIVLGEAGSVDDWTYIRQIGGSDSYHLTFDMHDNADSATIGQKFSIRNIASYPSADVITTRFHIDGVGNVGIGTDTPTEKLDVSGKTKTINFQMTSGATSGYVLTSDASGNASWQASTGGGGVSIDPYNNIGSTGTSFNWNVSGLSTNYEVTLTANTTLNLSNVRNGDYGTIIVQQDAVGSRTITFGTINGAAATHRVANGGGGSPVLTSNANAIDILTFTYNGSTMFWTVGNDYT